jgi:hypothetical protein
MEYNASFRGWRGLCDTQSVTAVRRTRQRIMLRIAIGTIVVILVMPPCYVGLSIVGNVIDCRAVTNIL